MPKRISDIDWSSLGGFGIPYNYESEKLAKRAEAGEAMTEEDWRKIEEWARLKVAVADGQQVDPISWGWITKSVLKALEYLPKAKVLVLLGGNRGGKSEGVAPIVVNTLLQIPEAVVSAWHQNNDLSITIGQDKVWKKIPLNYNGMELRGNSKIKGVDFSLDWKQKSGFSGGCCIIPPMHPMQIKGSELNFKTYAQYQNDKQVAEGYDSDLEWLDEEPPFELFKTLRSRINDRFGKLIWTCTLIKGYGELAAFVLDGAETIETHYSDWLMEELPLVQKSKTVDDCYIIYMPTEFNPFVSFDEIKKGLSGMSMEEKRVRAYGVPSRRSLTKFPRLNTEVHTYDDKTPDLPKTDDCTHYMVCDPAGRKRWVMLWYKVDKKGNVWVEREWPDMSNYGPWALPSTSNQTNKWKGSEGPAQNEGSDAGMGFASYTKLIRDIEEKMGWGKKGASLIYQRRIDPRGNKTQQGADDFSVTTIGEMAKQGIFFLKADGPNEVDPGLQKINDFLEYDMSKPVDENNHPKLRIHKRCGNLWSSMNMFTNLGGPDEHAKDFVDDLRYALMSNPININSANIGPQKVKRY